MNTNTTAPSKLDYIAIAVIVVPLVLAFGVVGIGGMLDQRKMSIKHHEQSAKANVTDVAAAKMASVAR